MNHLKAIIMAGGEGSRLRPLTCDCPKPMLRLMGKPLMEYALRLMQRYDIHEIAATLGYLPDSIMDYFGDGSNLGLRLHYYIEKTPLGTAGSVAQARDFLNERFIVLSGDGITDLDLSGALRFHAQKRALATLILKKSAHPQEYGMVVTRPDGRISAFHEKPGRSEIYSDMINTGIYILEPEILNHIPGKQSFDFGHDLFPALLKQGLPLYGYTAEGYWCDVGDVGAYLQVHADALDGKIHLPGLEPSAEGAILEGGCTLEAPVYIAPGCRIGAGARIGAYSVLDEGCRIAPGASIKRSILFRDAHVEANAQLRGCIIGTRATIGEGAQLFEESAVGSGSRLGPRATLPPGVKLWPEKSIPGGERPEENIVWGARREQCFIAGALQLDSPSQASRAAEACAAALKIKELLLGRDESGVAAALWHAAAAGAMAQGVQVIDAGACTLPQLRHALQSLRPDAAMLVCADRLILLNHAGAMLPERSQRDILKLLERQDFSGPFSAVTRPMVSAGNTAAAYIAQTAAAFDADPLCAPKIALCARRQLMETARNTIERAGLQVRCVYEWENLAPGPDEIGLVLPDEGERALISDRHGTLSETQRQLACAWTALEKGERRLLMPNHATRAIDEIAHAKNAHAVYMRGDDAIWMNALAEKAPLQFLLQFDGLHFALAFISLLTQQGITLNQWRQQMPAAWRSTRGIQVPSSESGRLLHAIASTMPGAELGGGVRLQTAKGWAWLGADDTLSQLNIIAEACDMEAARELCDFYDGEIQRLLHEAGD